MPEFRRIADRHSPSRIWCAFVAFAGAAVTGAVYTGCRPDAKNRRMTWHLELALQCHYALLSASINSLASNIPPPLLVALVDTQVWTPAQALAYALQVVNTELRAKALATLAPRLPLAEQVRVLHAALVVARALKDEAARATMLATIAPLLPVAEQAGVLEEALVVARALKDEAARATMLATIAPLLPTEEKIHDEALALARVSGDKAAQAKVLATIAPLLPVAEQASILEEALAAAQAIRHEAAAGHLLGTWKPSSPTPYPRETLAMADRRQATVLALLAPHLPTPLLEKVLLAAQEIWDEVARASVLASLAPRLPTSLMAKGLTAARVIGDKAAQVKVLVALAPQLPVVEQAGLLEVALTTAEKIKDEAALAIALTTIGPYLPDGEYILRSDLILGRVRGDTVAQVGEVAQATALTTIGPYLPHREYITGSALALAQASGDKEAQFKVLAVLEPHLLPAEVVEADLKLQQATANLRQAKMWLASSQHLPEPLLKEAQTVGAFENEAVQTAILEAASLIKDEVACAELLVTLAPHLQAPLPPKALEVARVIGDKVAREQALTALGPQLAKLPLMILYPLWRDTIHVLASRTRGDLLADLIAFIPVITALGGNEAVKETAQGIINICNWFP